MLVSFLRDWEFWNGEARRLVCLFHSGIFSYIYIYILICNMQGLDLARLSDKGQFAFVDGVSGLFKSSPAVVPDVRPPERNPPLAATKTHRGSKLLHVHTAGMTVLDSLEREIHSIIESLSSSSSSDNTNTEVLLIIDQPDLLLAATEDVGPTEMGTWIMALRRVYMNSLPIYGEHC